MLLKCLKARHWIWGFTQTRKDRTKLDEQQTSAGLLERHEPQPCEVFHNPFWKDMNNRISNYCLT